MITKNLQVGQRVKNYKVLCKLIYEKEKTNRQQHFKEMKRYFDFERDGQAFIITKIFKTPKPKENTHGGVRNKIPYIEQIKRLVLDLLVEDKNDGSISYSKYAFLNVLKMTNDNYYTGKYHIPKLCKLLEVNELNAQEFFERSSDTLTEHLEKALRQLENV